MYRAAHHSASRLKHRPVHRLKHPAATRPSRLALHNGAHPAPERRENHAGQELDGNRRGDMGVKTGHFRYQIADCRLRRKDDSLRVIQRSIIGDNMNSCQERAVRDRPDMLPSSFRLRPFAVCDLHFDLAALQAPRRLSSQFCTLISANIRIQNRERRTAGAVGGRKMPVTSLLVVVSELTPRPSPRRHSRPALKYRWTRPGFQAPAEGKAGTSLHTARDKGQDGGRGGGLTL